MQPEQYVHFFPATTIEQKPLLKQAKYKLLDPDILQHHVF